jgi:hypothetical protein
MTAESFSRALTKLKTENLIREEKGVLSLIDVDRLALVARGEPEL